MPETVRLSSHTTIKRYRELERARDGEEIVQFLQERFRERYFIPVETCQQPHGFFVMAITCLVIEGIQSFREGWQEVTQKRKKPYRRFFHDHPAFGISSDQADQLYDNVRSGILHQGETYRGWRILRRGPLVDFENRIINATAFFREVAKAFDKYCEALKRSPWPSGLWQNFRNRMHAVIRNCEP
jgi:hypothetical protein